MDKIQDSTPYSLFIWALGIILREGLEALIIVVAIVSYLVQSGNKNRLNIAYSALFTGVILSFITAFGVSWLFKENAGQSRELIEGITKLKNHPMFILSPCKEDCKARVNLKILS